MIDSQQWRSRIRLGSGDDDVIEVEAGRNAVEGQRIITRLNLGSQSGRDLFLGAAQNILMEASVVQQNVDRQHQRDDEEYQNAARPGGDFLPTRARRWPLLWTTRL